MNLLGVSARDDSQPTPGAFQAPCDSKDPAQRARDLPETALRAALRRLTPRPSTAPLTSVVVWAREVLRGVVNHRRIDGKDGVAGSIPAGGSTQALTSGNAGELPSGAVVAGHIRI